MYMYMKKIKKVCLSNHPRLGFGDADLESISGGAESEFLQSSASECLPRSVGKFVLGCGRIMCHKMVARRQ